MEMDVKALRLPKLSHTLVSAMNRFFLGGRLHAFTLDAHGGEMELGRKWVGGGVTLAVRGVWGPAEFELACRTVDADVVPLLLDMPESCAWRDLPPVLRLAAWEAALDAPLKSLSAVSRETAAVTAVEEFPERPLEPRADWLFFDWRFAGLAGTLHSAFRFSVPEAGLPILASALIPGAAMLPVPDDWPIEAVVELTTERMDLAALRGMEPGDIAILSEGEAVRGGRAWLKIGRKKSFPVALKDGGAEILEKTMAEPAHSGEPARKGGAVDGIEVNLTLELDSRLWQARELAQVQPGFVFETGKTLASPVTLKVNGRDWGKGELVDLDGKVGVRLLSLV